jgi:hypothetical protein
MFILLPEILAWYDCMQCGNSRFSHWVTGWTVRGTHPIWGKRCFSSPKDPARLWGSPSLLFNGSHYSLGRSKRLRRDVEQSPLFSVEVTNEWNYTPTLPIRLHGMDRDNFVFMSASEKCTCMLFLILMIFPSTALFCTIFSLSCGLFVLLCVRGLLYVPA